MNHNIPLNRIGMLYGTFKIVDKTEERGVWLCTCLNCGKISPKTLEHLRTRPEKCIGCPRDDNHVGEIIKSFKVVQKINTDRKGTVWLLVCTVCGYERHVRTYDFKTIEDCYECSRPKPFKPPLVSMRINLLRRIVRTCPCGVALKIYQPTYCSFRCRQRQERRNLRTEFIEAYGGKCQCPCGCAENIPEFMSLDHIYGGGDRHRASTGTHGVTMYRVLKKQGWPKDKYRLLCLNCNLARAHWGSCPFEGKRKVTNE